LTKETIEILQQKLENAEAIISLKTESERLADICYNLIACTHVV